ncbi:MAG: chorismate synthase [Oscillospiraceae bacterium]|nr:chorismate synthase [Oscillospiraceae bacterium]
MLRYFTAGETHGKCLTVIVEGMPSGVRISLDKINEQLAKRQKGYGRGGRMLIEKDTAEILSGVRGGVTLGSPIAIKIENRDWANWEKIMGTEESNGEKSVDCPRPGHADLTGGMKYNHRDLRNVLERASARETAARVAAGALVRQVLEPFGIEFLSHVKRIGEVEDTADFNAPDFFEKVQSSPVGFADELSAQKAMEYIDKIKADGESCGGIVETIVKGLPAGLGSYVHYDRKLDANIAFGVMSVQAIKGVEIGMGFGVSEKPGSHVHDEIEYNGEFHRITNNAGGIEGGMSNGEPIVVKAAMKPIPTLYNPLRTVNISDKSEHKATVERSDVCAVPACSVVVEAVIAFEITKAFLDKFSGDCMEDVKAYYDAYTDRIKKF